jgi:ligand-binding sensor domain-containing protein
MNTEIFSKLQRNFFIISCILIISNINIFSEESEWIHLTGNPARISCFAEDGDYLWMGVYNYGLIKFNMANDEYETFDTTNSGLKSYSITSIVKNDDGSLWIGTSDSGLLKKSGNNWQVFDSTNTGVSINHITCIASDKSGVLWIGTRGQGLFTFDGLKFKRYNNEESIFINSYIQTIFVDNDDKKWIGADENLIQITSKGWVYYNSTLSKFSTGRINSIQVENNGTIWMVTDDGVSKYDSLSWKIFDSKNSILPKYLDYCTMIIDKYGNKWISSDYWGLFKYDDKEWTVYNRNNSGLMDNSIKTFFISQNDSKWIGTWYEQLVKFSGNEWKQYRLYNTGLFDYEIMGMCLDKYGNIWANDRLHGFAKYNWKEWQTYSYSNTDMPYLDVPYYNDILVDTNGIIWRAMNGLGMQTFDGTDWSIYTPTNSGLSGVFYKSMIIDKKNNKYISTQNSTVKFDDVNWTALGSGSLNTMMVDNDSLFVGYYEGIAKFDGKNWIEYNFKISNVCSIAKDKKGNLWIASDQGLVKYDGKKRTIYDSTYTGFMNNAVFKIAVDENDVIWLISINGELSKFDGTNWKFINQFYYLGDWNNPTSLLIDKYGNKWMGTRGGGIFIYRENGVHLTSVKDTPEISEKQAGFIYPNPVSDILTISGEWNNACEYIITDYLGYEIQKGILSGNEIVVSSISKGIYFINIRDGLKSTTLKFVKI